MDSFTASGAPRSTPEQEALANKALAQWRGGANRTVLHAFKCQGNQEDDDQSVEDNR